MKKLIPVSSQIKVAADTVQSSSKKYLWVVLSPYTCFMSVFLYFLLSSEHLFASPVQVKNVLYCKTLCRNLPQVLPDVLCSLPGMSLPCLLPWPVLSHLSQLHFVPEAGASSSISSQVVPHSPSTAAAWWPRGAPALAVSGG